ncbi:MAG: TetR/AcrR family transcriptional regulator [Spirochaetes bacterium]|nr:TetR/AcrR family transcriptional regulator [Spirochaetota bacterium]MBX3723912.1 TetR/AcrR family transcriptional regulator [Turneriella sp.]
MFSFAEENSTRIRILNQAGQLFYKQGFNNTGMEQITKVTKLTKPSLYYHFKSKNQLGLAYLEMQQKGFHLFLSRLQSRSDTFEDYVVSWVHSLRHLARKDKFFGCPFSVFASEVPAEDRPFFEPRLREIERGWLAFQKEVALEFGFDAMEAEEVARKMMIAYTGCAMLYRLTHDARYLTDLENHLRALAHS